MVNDNINTCLKRFFATYCIELGERYCLLRPLNDVIKEKRKCCYFSLKTVFVDLLFSFLYVSVFLSCILVLSVTCCNLAKTFQIQCITLINQSLTTIFLTVANDVTWRTEGGIMQIFGLFKYSF